jgi:hypothetical protein
MANDDKLKDAILEKSKDIIDTTQRILLIFQEKAVVQNMDNHELVIDIMACMGALFSMATKDMTFEEKKRYLISYIELHVKMLKALMDDNGGAPDSPGMRPN